MQIVFSLFSSGFFVIFPSSILEWLVWLFFSGGIIYFLWRTWENPLPYLRKRWLIALILLGLAPILTAFIGFRLPVTVFPLPGVPIDPAAPVVMIFSSLPWILAAGLLGPLSAVILAFISGLILAAFETRSVFTPLELAGLSLVFSWLIRQNYRTLLFSLVRHPLISSILIGFISAPIIMLGAFFAANGNLAENLDYAITQSWFFILTRSIEFTLAGFIAEIVRILFGKMWGNPRPLEPSPLERSLQNRIYAVVFPMMVIVLMALIVGDWLAAGEAARSMVKENLSSTARMAADGLPYFLEAGQNLIVTMATPDLPLLSQEKLKLTLPERLRSVPFFRQLFVFDAQGNPISGYPVSEQIQLGMTLDEINAIKLALRGVGVQTYTIPPASNETMAQVSFIALIRNEQGNPAGVLLGRTDINTNPFTQPAIKVLETMKMKNGFGVLLDENQKILFSIDQSPVLSQYKGNIPEGNPFFDEATARGGRRYVYYQPVLGRKWAVIVGVPAQNVQQVSLSIFIPLLVILVLITMIVLLILRFTIGGITRKLGNLAQETAYIAQGQLNRAVPVGGVDEIGRLGNAFDQMRLSLKARLDELNHLLAVSQGVAGSLEIYSSIEPVLKAALISGASSARVILTKDVVYDPEVMGFVSVGYGRDGEVYSFLDSQLFEIAQSQDLLPISNVGRMRRLSIPPSARAPVSLIALAIRYEGIYYGALWVGFDHPRAFSESELRFLTTLAGQAALAASNARLYASAEVGRQRLEAILTSTPEPVLVVDDRNHLLMINPPAIQIPGLIAQNVLGAPLQEVIEPVELIELLIRPISEGTLSREIVLPSGKVFYASVSQVVVAGQIAGKVCILRDITHFKELESLKSDFVSTVSHDLRSPLTLMRGYATMLQMVGELNEQQKGYVKKIIAGVENMTRLVNNLLDLGRIEAGIDLQVQNVEINEIIFSVITTLQPQATQKNIQIEQDLLSLRTPIIAADRDLLQQAIYNLIDNAIKYTPQGGRVKIQCRSDEAKVVFEVSDNGIGIAPLDLPHLFEKFYRSGRREAHQQKGSGLGLAIVKSIADRHGGRIWVDSQLGKGSVFYLEMPIHQPEKTN
mgnify:CR=1 FL=1